MFSGEKVFPHVEPIEVQPCDVYVAPLLHMTYIIFAYPRTNLDEFSLTHHPLSVHLCKFLSCGVFCQYTCKILTILTRRAMETPVLDFWASDVGANWSKVNAVRSVGYARQAR